MLFNSSVNKIISSFDDLKKISKKHVNCQTKAFENLEIWGQECNNNAIHDVTAKLSTVFRKFSSDFVKDKSASFRFVSNLFKKFKEHDAELKSLEKYNLSLKKKEQQFFKEIQKCPSSKNIRDLDIKYQRTKTEREKSDIKLYEFGHEIETSKSILFKRNMKLLAEALKRQNEAERVLLEAMENLLDQIPDISNEEVDDINEITYKNKKLTEEICEEAKKKLTTLSSSSLLAKSSAAHEDTDGSIHIVCGEIKEEASQIKKDMRKTKIRTQTKTRISCPPKINRDENVSDKKIYPCLNQITEEEPPYVPPPTYSDSETFYATIRSKSSSVLPSAPSLFSTESENSKLTQVNTFVREKVSPTRNI
ncbi:unnamed protein product [Brachionus calyciflorus]|uniref:Uncharacterized protein n=1 Tax=Brachionus calyciflorus TaxID=104777 RepID=A0A813MWW5_9BILA|nr:unnamed protein product [Brachionus calyciflorus]